MARRKKLIWWESEPSVTSAEQSRIRGSQDEPASDHVDSSPYYGPVTIPWDADGGDDGIDRVAG